MTDVAWAIGWAVIIGGAWLAIAALAVGITSGAETQERADREAGRSE